MIEALPGDQQTEPDADTTDVEAAQDSNAAAFAGAPSELGSQVRTLHYTGCLLGTPRHALWFMVSLDSVHL